MRLLLLTLFTLSFFSAHSQKYADKAYYLVDKLPYDDLSSDSKIMVDHYLSYYYTYEDDLYKVSAIYEIVRNCFDERVWPLYNEWVSNFTKQKMEEGLSDSLNYIYTQLNIGTDYYKGWGHFTKGDYDKGIESFTSCYNRYSAIGDVQGAANATDNIGSMYSTKGEFAEALEYHMKGLKIREEIQDTLGLGASYNAIGIVHMSHGDYFQAIEDLEKSATYHAQVGYWSGVSNAYSNLGRILSDLEDYDQSLEFHLESYKIKEQLQDKQGMTISLNSIAAICVLAGDTASAIEYINYSLQLAQEIGDQRGIASAMGYMGYIHFLKDEYDEGVKHCNKALAISEEIGTQFGIRGSLQHLFLGHLWWGKYEKAEEFSDRLVEMRRRDIKVNFAILPEQQKEMYFSTMAEEFQNLYAFGNLVREENPDVTVTLYDNTLLLKGLLLQSTTAMREAILSSDDAKLIEQYDNWITLKTQIADAYAKDLDTENLEDEANKLEEDLVKKSASFDAFQTGSATSWEDIKTKLGDSEAAVEFIRYPLNLGDVASPIIYAALIVKANSEYPEMINLCTEEDLVNILGKVGANNITFVNDVYGTKTATDQELSKLIWDPIKESLKETKKLFYAPEGLLHKVAFSAVRTAEDEFLCDQFELVQMGSTAEMLKTNEFNFAEENSVTLFGGVKYSTDSSEHVIWNYLPGSLEEVDSISGIINQDMQMKTYVGHDASEGKFKEMANKSNILHIASHGFFYPDPEVIRAEVKIEIDQEDMSFRGSSSNYGIWNFVNNENPLMRSGLAMAGANDAWQRSVFAKGEDGVLSAQEVSNLNMTNTELVVLSACETGLGDIKGSEGVYGLQRAFKMAGVHYLIMSLWQVPDEETAEFMTSFYKLLIDSGDIRKAFDTAQSEMRKKYDPYYWAAFVLIE